MMHNWARARFAFAKAYGYQEEDLLTDRSRLAWRMWKRELRDHGGHTELGEQHGCAAQKKIAEQKKAFPEWMKKRLWNGHGSR